MMVLFYIALFLISAANAEFVANSTNCSEFQANFALKDVIGFWHVVAIIPEKMFPEKPVTCYKAEISETDEAGLKWLINKTVEAPKTVLLHDTEGIVIRQRYYTKSPFDVWSKSLQGFQGCFQQVISMDVEKNDVHKAVKHDAMMQLHLLEVNGGEPFLLQLLWGRMVAVVIYRRNQGVTRDELKPAFELVNKLRGPQRLPRICDTHIHDLLML